MPTLGETFRTTREAKRIKLTQVAERTAIPLERLQALESDRYMDLPDDVYLKGQIRNYALFLELNPNEAVTRYREVRPEQERIVPLSGARTTTRIAALPVTILVVVILILLLVALFALHVI